MKQDAILKLVEDVSTELEQYRETQCRKYYAEKNTEHMGDYVKLERYKNRVRVVDCFLDPLERFLFNCGVMKVNPSEFKAQRTQID